MSDHLCVLAQPAEGRGFVQVDRDGEGRATFLMSASDAALLIAKIPEYASGVYITLVPAHAVQATTPKRKRRASDDV